MNQPWIYMCSPSGSPLPPPSASHPSGSSQCTSPEHLSHASNVGWWSVSPLIVYLFQCYSPLGFLKNTSSGLMGFVWLMGPEPWGTRLNKYCPRISSCNLRSYSVSLITCCVSPTKYIWLACQYQIGNQLGINFSKPFAGFFPKNCTLSLIHGFCFLQFVLCLLCTLPSSCPKSSLDSRAVLQGSFLGLEGSELGCFMNKEQWLPIAKATQGLHTQLCLIGKSQPRSGRAHRGGLRPGTAGLDTWKSSRSIRPL